MSKKQKLTKNITEDQFNNGYWYADEIKSFAKELGIPGSSRLRKDELENLTRIYLRTGKIGAQNKKRTAPAGKRDFESGLKLNLQVINYTSNKATKNFIKQEALKINPALKKKPGVSYRLNRWREEQITKSKKITYGDLVKKYIQLNETEEPFERIPQARYINFLSDYLANEKEPGRDEAIKAWQELKKLNIPKDYRSWKNLKEKQKDNQSPR